jgi:hypothetical protein
VINIGFDLFRLLDYLFLDEERQDARLRKARFKDEEKLDYQK